MKNLSEDQVKEFDEQGYLLLKQWVPTDFVSNVCKSAETALDNLTQKPWNQCNNNEMSLTWKGGQHYIGAMIYPHRHMYPTSLNLLGSPWVLGVAESLCGKGSMSTYTALIAKHREAGEWFNWHQDMVHDRSSRIIVITVFLSEAHAAGDALTVIPKTQHVFQEIPELINETDAVTKAVPLGVMPGDVTVHDVMTVHWSKALELVDRRLALTFEFRSPEHITSNNVFSKKWISAREELWRLEQRKYEELASGTGTGQGTAVEASEEESRIIEAFYNIHEVCRLEVANYGQHGLMRTGTL